MIVKLFSIYDVKAECYEKPFFMKTTSMAIRAFQDVVNDENVQSAIAQHPEDYILFEIGTFCDEDASFQIYEAPVSVGKGIEFKKVHPAVEQFVEEK